MKSFKQLTTSVGIVALSLTLTGCPEDLPMYSPDETNLQSLTRITDDESSKFDAPFGGDNGRALFFAMRDRRGSSNIFRMDNPLSKAMSPKTSGMNFNSSPTFCLQTNQLAYAGRTEGAYSNDIFMMDASQGAAIRRLTNTPMESEFNPCISADGTTIVYEKRYINGFLSDTQIWKQDTQTEASTLLCQGLEPSLSHDGRYIVFTRFASDGNNRCLMIMDIDGQGQTQLTDSKMGVVGKPRFSPDDQQIVFQCLKNDKKDVDLYVINRDGTGITQLTFNKSFDAEPYWADDGNIYFSSDRGGRANNFQIWRFQYRGAYSTATPAAPVAPQPVVRTTPASTTVSNTTPATAGRTHTVKDGDTITSIARQYGVTVRDIVRWNNLTTMTITPGMQLKVSAQ